MKLQQPALMGVDEKFSFGRVRQLLLPAAELSGRAVKYTMNQHAGFRFTPEDSEQDLYLFRKPPEGSSFPASSGVLVCKLPDELGETIDVTHGKWWQHALRPAADARTAARQSWRGAFRYADEDAVNPGDIALRRPQLGALHAIHAHWSVSGGVATIVMPTGTGKTETMLATLTSARCERVLILVPTDALRTQVADKFLSLGVLKMQRNVILDASAQRPVVGTLTSIPKTATDVDEFFGRCNVVVTTSALAGGCSEEIQLRMASHCTHLFIDEAHHAEAPTWKAFKERYADKRVLQFTATPFREDDQPLDGKIIYVYPLRRAQEDGYFRPIRFSSVYEFDLARADRAIARKVLEELESDPTGKHVAMARVSSTQRATEVFELYRALGRYGPVVLHSKIKVRDREAARANLFSGQSRIVVCVDMLGEGFDMPELKIAAFHDIRKSLAVTLQLAGRFTRARVDLGDPVFIANTADVDLREELRKLYSQDPDWNALLPELSDDAIAEEVDAQQYLAGFDGAVNDFPVKELRPAASMVVYRTTCANWTPKEFRAGFKGLSRKEHVYPFLNERENTLVVVTATKRGVPWTAIASVQEFVWELFIAVWDRALALLFIHGSSNSSEFKDLAKALCGEGASIVVDPIVYRAFHGINRLVLTNVGLDDHFGRQIRYTGRMGADVGARLSDPTKQSSRKAVLAGMGFENGGPTSVGAAKRGRVWSNQRLRVSTFAKWCRLIGAKIVDENIDAEEVLRGTLVPKVVSERPRVAAIGVDWPSLLLDHVESATAISLSGRDEAFLTMVSIEIVDGPVEAPLVVRLFTEDREVAVRLDFFTAGESSDFRFVYAGPVTAKIRRGGTMDLCDFLTENAPTIWFADGSSLEGNLHVELTAKYGPYDREKLRTRDWSGIDIRKESQGEVRAASTVQFRVIEWLKQAGGYDVIFDDDGAGEAADIVAVRVDDADRPRRIDVELYHCKYSLGDAPGGRVDDLYVVCGQAQRSVMWLHNKDRRTDMFAHLLKRDAMRVEGGRPTRFEVGDTHRLAQLRDLSRSCEVRLNVFIVQPGVSKSKVSGSQLALLSVTERYLFETYQVPFSVFCSA